MELPYDETSKADLWHMRAKKTFAQYLHRHETAALNVTIGANLAMFFLHFFDRASFQTIEPTIVGNWVNHQFWSILFLGSALWLIFFRRPPKVVWGLWVSIATFFIWGSLDLTVGLTASHLVSLLGPILLLFVVTPIAWLAADSITEYAEAEKSNVHIPD